MHKFLRDWDISLGAIAGVIVGAIILWALSSYAQPADDCVVGAYGCGHEENHDQYKDWKQEGGMSCCSGEDCRPVRAKQDADGNWLIWIPELRRWDPVPADAMQEPDRFHDGRSHACTSKPTNPMAGGRVWIYCFSPAQTKG